MGRYEFRAARVHQTVTQFLTVDRISQRPRWYDTVGSIDTPQILVRTQPLAHQEKCRGRPSRSFRPQKITYEEDELRRRFFTDHPWELARPRVVLENDGKDWQNLDWSSINPPGKTLSGENVIQRQLWLMEHESRSKKEAYDQARREFYVLRLQEDVERRVAKEEAMATGAYFGKTMVQIGSELEDEAYERWRTWADEEATKISQARTAQSSGAGLEVAQPEEGGTDEEDGQEDEQPEDTLGQRSGKNP